MPPMARQAAARMSGRDCGARDIHSKVKSTHEDPQEELLFWASPATPNRQGLSVLLAFFLTQEIVLLSGTEYLQNLFSE